MTPPSLSVSAHGLRSLLCACQRHTKPQKGLNIQGFNATLPACCGFQTGTRHGLQPDAIASIESALSGHVPTPSAGNNRDDCPHCSHALSQRATQLMQHVFIFFTLAVPGQYVSRERIPRAMGAAGWRRVVGRSFRDAQSHRRKPPWRNATAVRRCALHQSAALPPSPPCLSLILQLAATATHTTPHQKACNRRARLFVVRTAGSTSPALSRLLQRANRPRTHCTRTTTAIRACARLHCRSGHRYMTWVGDILCVMNPFQLVNADFVHEPGLARYLNIPNKSAWPPHQFALANFAFQKMLLHTKNQVHTPVPCTFSPAPAVDHSSVSAIPILCYSNEHRVAITGLVAHFTRTPRNSRTCTRAI